MDLPPLPLDISWRLIRRGSRAAAILFGAAALLAASPARAVDDLGLDYKTIETEHFYVHYADRLEGFARRTARVAEEAHHMMTPLFDYEPSDRTHVVVNDKIDSANGSANVSGRNAMQIFAMPPAPESTLGYYSDWLRVLVYHEYAHILHLDTTEGLIDTIKNVFGASIHINTTLPRWYIEGLAVLYESHLTGSGRNNSSLFQMWLRTAALEHRLFSLGAASNTPIDWPQVTTWYLYGGSFMEYVTDKYGRDFATSFNHLYGRRLIPYSLNQSAREVGAESFDRLWREWDAHQRGESWAEHVAVSARGRTAVEQVSKGGGTRRHPHVRPGADSVTFYHNGLNSHAAFAATRTSTRRSDPLFEVDGAVGSSDWTPDGEVLVYGRGTVERSLYTYQDLHTWDSTTGERRQLTDGDRARDPAVAPDGERIAYVRVRPGTTDLVVCAFVHRRVDDCTTVAGGTLHPADDDRHWQQIASPTWGPEGERLAFSRWWLPDEKRDLWMLRVDGSRGTTPRRITDDAAQDTAPEFGPDGRLYWSADRTGIFNVYARDLEDDRTWQLSEVDTGMFQPCVSPDGEWIYAVTYTSDGYELGRIRYPTGALESAPESYPIPSRPQYPDVDPSDWKQTDYSPPRWLHPFRGSPDFGATVNGGGAGASIFGMGPVGHHSWELRFAILSSPEFVDVRGRASLRYQWTGGPFNLNLAAGFQENPRRRGLFAENEQIPFLEREYLGSVGLGFPLRRIDSRLSLSTSYDVRRTQFRNRPETQPSPTDRRPREPDFGWSNQLTTTISYAELDRYAQSISIERGISGRVSLSLRDELLGSDFESTRLTYALQGFLPNPWIDRHVAAIRLVGGIGRSGRGDPVFALGGYRPEDVISDIVFQDTSGQFVLRGYPPASIFGSRFQVWTAGYRFPILRLDKGASTVPVFLRRIKGELFADAGGAFNDVLADADLRTSIGARVQLGTQFFYLSRGSLFAGFARGLSEGGINEFFLRFGGGF